MKNWRGWRPTSPVAALSRWFPVALAVPVIAVFGSACQPLVSATIPAGQVPATVNIPIGAQIGTGRIPVTCQVPVLGPMVFTADATGAVATRLGPGQQFYITEVHGALEVPDGLRGLAPLLDIKTVDAKLTRLDIETNNASPSVVNAASPEWDIPNIPMPPAGTPMVVAAPVDGHKVLGPFTAGNSGSVELVLGEVDVEITLKNSQGQVVLFPLDITCQPPPSPSVIVAINIDPNAPSSPPSRYDGVNTPDFGLSIGDVEGSLSAPLSCNVGGYGQRTLGAIMTAELPMWLPSDEQYRLRNATGAVVIPPDLVDEMLANNPTATQADGTITRVDIHSDNSLPAVLNIADPPIAAPRGPLVSGQLFDIGIPDSGTLTVGPWTLGPGPSTTMTWGAAAGSLRLLDAQGQQVGSTIPIDCDPPAGPVILLRQYVTDPPHPVVTSLSATSGPAAGGNQITISGSGFTGAMGVNFGAGSGSFTVNNDTTITVTVPAGTGTVDVTVLGPNGPSGFGAADQYTYN